jgi:hypothetical protein
MNKKSKGKISREEKITMAKTASGLTGYKLENTLLILEGICKDKEHNSKSVSKIFVLLLRKLQHQRVYLKNKNQSNENESDNPDSSFIYL